MTLKDILTLIQIFATAAVGFAALYISHQQYKANRTKILFELFNERYTVYISLLNLVRNAIKDIQKIDASSWANYYIARNKAEFLFDRHITEYMEQVSKAIRSTITYERNPNIGLEWDKTEYIAAQIDGINLAFKPFLKVEIKDEELFFSDFLSKIRTTCWLKLTELTRRGHNFFTGFLSKFFK